MQLSTSVSRRNVLPLALAILALAALALAVTIQADDGGPFAASSVSPTTDKVDVGDEVGFSLHVANAAPVTATDVLVWNPLPAGTSYVSASGGAFPIVGDVTGRTIPSAPPGGQAYDAQLGTSVPLTDLSEVTGIAWMGDVPAEGTVTPGLTVTVHGPAGRALVDEAFLYDDGELVEQFSGQTWVRSYSHYLPFLINRAESPSVPTPSPTPPPTPVPTVTLILTPTEAGVVASSAETRQEALAGSQIGGWPNGGEFHVHAQHDTWIYITTTADLPAYPYRSPEALFPGTTLTKTEEFWSFVRQYYEFDVPPGAVPVELRLPIFLHAIEPVTGTAPLAVHPGTWQGPIAPTPYVWTAWEATELGRLTLTTPLSLTLPFTLTVPLEPTAANTTTLRLVVRLACEEEACTPPEFDWFLRAFMGSGVSLEVIAPEERR